MSGWIWNRPSQSAADDPEGSYRAGSESVPCVCGAQPAPIEDAISVGTMVIMDDLIGNVSVETRSRGDDEQRDSTVTVHTRRTTLPDKRRRTHTGTTEVGKGCQIVANKLNGFVPFRVGLNSGQCFGAREESQKDEQSFEWFVW